MSARRVVDSSITAIADGARYNVRLNGDPFGVIERVGDEFRLVGERFHWPTLGGVLDHLVVLYERRPDA